MNVADNESEWKRDLAYKESKWLNHPGMARWSLVNVRICCHDDPKSPELRYQLPLSQLGNFSVIATSGDANLLMKIQLKSSPKPNSAPRRELPSSSLWRMKRLINKLQKFHYLELCGMQRARRMSEADLIKPKQLRVSRLLQNLPAMRNL